MSIYPRRFSGLVGKYSQIGSLVDVVLEVVGLVVVAYVLWGCCPKCVQTPPLPAKVITVREGCMDPLPELSSFKWPAPNANGSITVSSKAALDFLTLLNYVESQYTRCRKN